MDWKSRLTSENAISSCHIVPGDLIYIIGKASDLNGNFDDSYSGLFEEYEDIIYHAGFRAINPVKMYDQSERREWSFYMKHDISTMLTRAKAVMVIDNWYLSRGAVIEVTLCTILGIIILDKNFNIYKFRDEPIEYMSELFKHINHFCE